MASQRIEFDVGGFLVHVTVGGDAELDERATAELRDVVMVAARWTQAHKRGIRIPSVPAVPTYEPLPPSLPGEIWRAIPEFEHSHEASNQYRVRSISRIVESAHPSVIGGPRHTKPVRGRLLKTRVRGNIAYVTLIQDGKQRVFKVKDLVGAAFPELAGA